MFDETVAGEVGTVIHRAIARAVTAGVSPDNCAALVQELWHESALSSSAGWQTRTRVTNRVQLYLRALRPVGWDLLGVEVRLPGCVADLVYERFDSCDGISEIFIDEVKTGRRPLECPELVDQVQRLTLAGEARWGDAFSGVRVAELNRVSKVGFWASDGFALCRIPGPSLTAPAGGR